MKMKKIVTFALASSLILTLSAPANAAADIYDEKMNISFSDIQPEDISHEPIVLPAIEESVEAEISLLDDTPSIEITISTPDELRDFRDKVNSQDAAYLNAYVTLDADIDLEGEDWVPIGYSYDIKTPLNNYAFRGTFDGQGHTISNYKFTKSDQYIIGLFGVASYAKIVNINISDAVMDIDSSDNLNYTDAHGMYGMLIGCALNFNEVYNINVNGSVDISPDSEYTVELPSQAINIGMIVGYGNIQAYNLSASGNININTLKEIRVGGLCGYNSVTDNAQEYYLKDSASNVSMSVNTGTAAGFIGGVVGYFNQPTLTLSNLSYNAPDGIQCSGDSMYLGGISGYSFTNFDNCTVGAVPLTNSAASVATSGGITSSSSYSVSNCSVYADISSESNSDASGKPNALGNALVAGIVTSSGFPSDADSPLTTKNTNIIKNCVFGDGTNGSLSSTVNGSKGGVYAGGIVGLLYSNMSVENCTTNFKNINVTSNVSSVAPIYASGICGFSYGAPIKQCYAKGDINVTSLASSYIGGLVGELTGILQNYSIADGDTTTTETYNYGGSLSDSMADVNINASSKSVYAGGIAGYLYAKEIYDNHQPIAQRCSASGNINVPSNFSTTMAGGGFGYSIDSDIIDCYVTGNTYINTTAAKNVFAGAFIGRIKDNSKLTTEILSHNKNCYTSGILTLVSEVIIGGPFTSQISGNGATPAVNPEVTNCYYICAEIPSTELIGTPILKDAALDTASYDGFDFDKTWYMSANGPKLDVNKPGICTYNYIYDNGIVIGLESIDVTQPENIEKIVVNTVSVSDGTISETKEYNPEDYILTGNYFVNIPVNVEPDIFHTFTVNTILKTPVEVSNTELNSSSAKASVCNISQTPQSVSIAVAGYDEDGRFTGVTTNSQTVEPNRTAVIDVTGENAVSVKGFVWDLNNVKPLTKSIS